jgi:hypothetical protein
MSWSPSRSWPGVFVGAICASTAAYAEPPDKVASAFDAAETKIHRLTSSIDGGLVAGVTTGGTLVVLDTDAWTTATASPCTARSVALQARDLDVEGVEDGYFVYVGCDDGTIRTWRWYNGNLGAYRPVSDDADTADTDTTDDVEIFDVAQNAIVGLWLGGDGYLYALTEADGDRLRLHDVDPSTGVDDELTPQIELLVRDFSQAVIAGNFDGQSGSIYVAHGGNDFSSINLGTRTLLTAAAGVGLSVSIDEITPAPLLNGVPNGIYIADTDRGLYYYSGGGTSGGINQTLQIVDGTLSGIKSLVVTYDEDRRTVEHLVVHDNRFIKTFPSSSGASTGTLGEPLTSFEVDFTTTDMIEGPHGYVVAATSTGQFNVLTANPWLEVSTLSPASGVKGTEVTVTFTADTGGTWRIMVGGDRTGAGGAELASGDLDVAGAVTTTFTVSEDFVEGTNFLYLLFTEQGSGLVGHVRRTYAVDNPPEQVTLLPGHVGFGNEKLLLDFPALTASDIETYHVYLSTESFSGADYATDGPDFVGSDKITNPIVVAAPSDGSRVTTEIKNLSNNVTYYLAVRAIDAGGLEGPMSRVVEGRPRPTNLASAIVGEKGGPACATGPGLGGGLALIGLASMGLVRRRSAVVASALCLAIGLGSTAARAQDDVPPILSKDSTPAWASFEAGYEFLVVSQTGLRDVYGPMFGNVRLEAGPQFFRVLELDLGVGILTKKGNTLDDSGAESTEVAKMTWVPLSLGATARIHILDEQPVVPYVSAGLDWVFFRENALDAEGVADKSTRITGSKNGWHWGVGANILLDLFAPARAGRLEAITGINDTWLVVGYKQQRVGPNDGGFDFSGWAMTVGVKVDY